MAYDYTMKGNPLLSGFQAGQAIGSGLRGAFVERPAIEEAMAQIQGGADPMQVYQQLAANDPRSANQLLQQINAQQTVRQNQMNLNAAQQQQATQQRFNETMQQPMTYKTIKTLAMIDPAKTNELLTALNTADQRSLQYFTTSLLGAVNMTNPDAQKNVLTELSTDIQDVNPALGAQVAEIASIDDPEQRSMMLQAAVRLIGEGGFGGQGRRVQSTERGEAGTRLIFNDGSVEFIPATEEELAAVQELETSKSPKLSAALEKAQIAAVENARKSRSELSKIQELITGFNNISSRGGVVTSIGEFAKQALGDEDAETMLRTQYRAIRNSQAVNNLPPGVASDKDIELALSGFPKDSASPEFISQWLRGVEKLERYNIQYNDFLSEWISNAGNIYTTRRPFEIGGVQVKPGDTLKGAFRKYLEQKGAQGTSAKSADDYLQEVGN